MCPLLVFGGVGRLTSSRGTKESLGIGMGLVASERSLVLEALLLNDLLGMKDWR